MSDLLELRSIEGGYGEIKVVRDVSLSVRACSISALFGPNGAGKTTTVRIASGLNACTGGSVFLGGVDISKLTPYQRVRRGLAVVQEGKKIFKGLTVEENLILGGYGLRVARRKLAGQIDNAYQRFPILGERRKRAAGSLSGGQQQMLAIAQALIPEPKVLLLDEPSAGLAPTIVLQVFEELRRLRDEGLAVLLVEQAVDYALAFCDDLTVLEFGRVAYFGHVSDPGIRDAVRKIYFGSTSDSEGANWLER